MNKNFTKDDIIKKHNTNIKSAQGSFAMTALLSIIYAIRFFGGNDFYFSYSSTEYFLKLWRAEKLSPALAFSACAVIMICYIVVILLTTKKNFYLKIALGMYCGDIVFLILSVVFQKEITSGNIIDFIFHLMIIVFIVGGIYSDKKLKEMKD